MASELPHELQTTKIKHNLKLISRDRLIALWKCFSSDNTFNSTLNIVLKQWALIPTKDAYLYSTSSKVLPIFPLQRAFSSKPAILNAPVPITDAEAEKVFATICLPFIDTAMTSSALLPCPKLADRTAILKNLYYLSQSTSLPKLLTKEMLKVIFDYFRTIDFQSDGESLSYIKSLPIFETVDGGFCAIEGKNVFQWNFSVATAGYSQWIKCHNVTFLQPSGAWSSIGTKQLKITSIEGEKIYSQYIFKAFDSMKKDDRYLHLKHIKDHLFHSNKNDYKEYVYKRNETRQRYWRAKEFIDGLKTLCCIGEDDEPLRAVSEFCDHTLPIFTSFRRKYRFLPTFFTDEKVWFNWVSFFCRVGFETNRHKGRIFISLSFYC